MNKYENSYKDVLKEYGYTYISGEYKTTKSKMKCYDKEGYVVYPCLDKLLNSQKRPRIVDKNNPSSIQNINKYLSENTNNEYSCISKEYKDNKSPLKILHKKCGRTFENSWINIGRGRYIDRGGLNKTGAFCPFCESKKLESSHALVLKQVWMHEHPDTIVEDRSCINPITNCSLPTDIVNHRLKIAIEIQSWFHDFDEQKKKDKIKKNFWINKGYKFYDIDQRNYTILEMIKIFFPNYVEIPEYVDFDYSNKINDVKIQKLLNEGMKIPQISEIVKCKKHQIYDAIQYGRIEYPTSYINADKQQIVQLDLEGNYINEFNSLSEAEEYTGSKNISACLQKGRNYSNGFYWVKKDEYCSGEYKLKSYRSKKFLIPVDKCNLDGTIEKHYETIIEASKDNNCSNSDIYRVIIGKRQKCKGFIWKAS